jgi:pyruvate/oxaloacetate carboxyltransferase
MTELEWLKQQSGLTDDELKAMEAVAGHAKFVGMLQKIMGENSAALQAKTDAEKITLNFEKRYNDEFIPEMRKVTNDALTAQGEAARLKAQLDKAREYGIVPEAEKPVVDPNAPQPRAPGSPDPNVMTRDDFGRFSQAQSNVLVTLSDLNAEHFKLKGEPLGNTQELVDEVLKQRTLGNKNYSLRQAWETKYEVPKLREEIKAKDQKKHDDEVVAAALKVEREKQGANPNLRSGAPSRFSTYKPSDAEGGKPWAKRGVISPDGHTSPRNKEWRDKVVSVVRAA